MPGKATLQKSEIYITAPTVLLVHANSFLNLSFLWSLSVLQDRITAFWFRGKELGLAFGLTLGFSRLGSVLNFFLTLKFEEKYGMHWTLWGGGFVALLNNDKFCKKFWLKYEEVLKFECFISMQNGI